MAVVDRQGPNGTIPSLVFGELREGTYDLVPKGGGPVRATATVRGNEVTRFKGLGEISAGEFKQFISTDDRLVPVTIGSMGDVKEALDFYMGKNTPARREFIVENLISDIA